MNKVTNQPQEETQERRLLCCAELTNRHLREWKELVSHSTGTRACGRKGAMFPDRGPSNMDDSQDNDFNSCKNIGSPGFVRNLRMHKNLIERDIGATNKRLLAITTEYKKYCLICTELFVKLTLNIAHCTMYLDLCYICVIVQIT